MKDILLNLDQIEQAPVLSFSPEQLRNYTEAVNDKTGSYSFHL